MIFRDRSYYLETGDLVIQVEDTLFRIHKGAFMREPSVFADMFFAPGQNTEKLKEQDGASDRQPLVLVGDTPIEFRALCWIMYASPADIVSISHRSKSVPMRWDFESLLSLALIAHKYMFTRIEQWARELIIECVNMSVDSALASLKSAIFSFKEAPQEELVRIVHYSMITGDPKLLKCAKDEILRRFEASPQLLKSVEALCICEANDWKDMQGQIYYRIVCDAVKAAMNDGAPNTQSPATFTSKLPDGLSHAHQLRLVNGYLVLINLYDHIMSDLRVHLAGGTPVNFREHLEKPSVDVLGHLDVLIRNVPKSKARKWSEMTREVKDNLADYFLGPLDPVFLQSS